MSTETCSSPSPQHEETGTPGVSAHAARFHHEPPTLAADLGIVTLRRRERPTPAPRGRVVILSATVGQGHEGAARELERRLVDSGVDVAVHDYLDALPAPWRRGLRDLYAPTVQYAPRVFDRMFQSLEHDGPLRRVANAVCASAEATVERWTRDADVVVSTYPLAGQTLGGLRRQHRLPATSVTYLTDPAAHVLWCHPAIDVHLTVTTATARDVRRYGVDAEAGGPLCRPGFDHPRRARHAVRDELGLPGDAPVALMSTGSLGMGAVPRAVHDVLEHPRARVIVLCGRNEALRLRLSEDRRVVALGWRDDVPELMNAADVLIHNAGGLSFTEALVAGLPTITYLPIPGHGLANAAVLERAGIASWPRTPAALVSALDDSCALGTGRAAWPPGADPATAVRRLLATRADAPSRRAA